jgi:hypothetical protein
VEIMDAVDVQLVSKNAQAPPARATSKDSTASWRRRALRVAPIAERIANSRRRAQPRERKRLLTLAQAIKSTKPTAQKRMVRGACESLTKDCFREVA